jgi:hypothetical protein
MLGPLQQTPAFNPQAATADTAPLPLEAQAQAYAAKLAPTINMQHQGGIPGGMSMGPHANPLIPKNPWTGQTPMPGATAPAIPSLAGYFGVTAPMLSRWTSPQSGATLG